MLHQIARFTSVVPLIRELGPGELLDVGSGSDGVAGWLGPAWRVTALDVSFAQAGALPGPNGAASRRVVGDARELPFQNGAFDVVLALDVLEHIPSADRARVLDELVRAARHRLIVACPTGEPALAADRRLAAHLRARGLIPPDWLLEHEANGFPDREYLRERLCGHGRLRLLPNENIRWHEWLFRFESRRPGFHVSRAAARLLVAGLASPRLLRSAAEVASKGAQGPNRPPGYRTIAVLDLPG